MSGHGHNGILQTYDKDASWHTVDADRSMEMLEVSPDGLSSQEAERRLEHFGPNELPKKEPPSLQKVFVHQFRSPLIYILMIAGAVSLAIGEMADAIFIFGVVLLNAVIGTFQEYKSEQSAAELEKMMQTTATVRRDGDEKEIDTSNVVLGDIVILASGARIPADLRIITQNNLSVDEALLTGESETVSKQSDALKEDDLDAADQTSMAFAGTTVMAGRAKGVCVRIGLDTELGRIAEVVTGEETVKPPLVIRMDQFVKQLSFAILAAVVVLSAVLVLQGTNWIEMFFVAIALAVSAIPEGLPVGTTVALSVGLRRMASRKVIIRRLAAVEGLGSCTYIISDKTGTLTLNRQTVRLLSLPGEDGFRRYEVSGEPYSDEGKVSSLETDDEVPEERHEQIAELARAGVLSSEGRLSRDDDEWKGEGDPIDIGFLALGYKVDQDPQQLREECSVTNRIPYESEHQLAAAFFSCHERHRVAAKGAAEAIVRRCDTMYHPDGERELVADEIIREANALAEKGFRVLAVASARTPEPQQSGKELTPDDLPPMTLLGLVGFIDPLRPEVRGAVQECRSAGVRVGMVTGDHPKTALKIAKDLDIAESEDDLLSGADLKEDDAALQEQIKSISVFARINPLGKVRIVGALRNEGNFVAVTGDGVNDAPALRKAHIGIAMGSGTDVTKQTGSIIITDDNFASIVNGIEEGRRAYQNFRKVTYLLVSTGAAEVIFMLLALTLGLPLPLVAVQLLWLNLVTNGIQDVALAFERGEPGIMKQPPRDPDEPIFNRLMIQQTLVNGGTIALVSLGLWAYLMNQNMPVAEARNHVLLLMVFFENFHAFNCRSETESVFRIPLKNNLLLVFAVPLVLGLHVASMHLPFIGDVLGMEPVSLTTALMLFALASTVLLASEVFKYIKRRGLRRYQEAGK